MVNVSNRGSIANFLRKLFSHLINKICNEFREFQRLNMAFKKLDHKIFSQEIICEIYENEFDLILKSWQSLCRCRQQLARNSTEFVSA